MRIAIIGAGPGGLAAAHYLQSRFSTRPEIHIIDGATMAGGLASGFRGSPAWEWPLERFYHHLFTNDEYIINLTKELGLEELLETHAPITSYFFAGRNFQFDSAKHLISFPYLSLLDKLRMGLTLGYLKWHPKPPWSLYDSVTAEAWLQSHMGVKAYEALWQPLLEAKFGDLYHQVALSWFAARIFKRTPRLIYFKGGFQAWADELLAANRALGASVHMETRVSQVTRTPEGWKVEAQGQSWDVDAVLFTGSPQMLCQTCLDLPDSYREQVDKEKFMGAVVLTLATDRSLTNGTYWLSIPSDAGLPFLVLVEHTAMVSCEHYGGQHVYYLGSYVAQGHRYLSMDESELAREFEAGLRKLAPEFGSHKILGRWLHRTSYAQPVPVLGFGASRLPLQTPLEGLYLATMSQVWPWDRGTNYAVEIGQRAARTMGVHLQL